MKNYQILTKFYKQRISMSDVLTPQKNFTVNIDNDDEHDLIVKLGHALSVKERVMILKNLLYSSKNLSSIAQELNIPVSSVSRHIDALAEAGLVYLTYQPGLKGHIKFVSQAILGFSVSLEPTHATAEKEEYTVEMPLGMFTSCDIKAPCGMVGKENKIEDFDNPSVFFSPARANAECIWFDSGFISYLFPSYPLSHRRCSKISFSFEICSETIYFNNNWPSDITIRVNDVELLTFTSPGDFGGRRGKYTPVYWPITSTQFGLLKKVAVNDDGVFLDNVLITNKIRFSDLKLYEHNAVKFEIGIKEDAEHRGGLNLFGKNFGDFPQSIVMAVK